MTAHPDTPQVVTWATKGSRLVLTTRIAIAGNAVVLALAVGGAAFQILHVVRGGNPVLVAVLLIWSAGLGYVSTRDLVRGLRLRRALISGAPRS